MNINLDNQVKHTPLVSIIAIAYNHEEFLEEALDSIIAQTYPEIEIVLVDACSKDQSVSKINAWIARNPDVKVKTIFQSSTKKITENANDALELVEGEYYQVLSCDDVLLPHKIKDQVNLFQQSDNQLGVVYCDAEKIDRESKSMHLPTFFQERNWTSASQLPSGMIFPILLMDYFICAPTVLVKKELALKVGGYNPESMMEDLDLFLKMAQNYSFKGILQVGVKYRILETSLLRSTDPFHRQATRLKIYSDYLGQKGEWDRFILYQFLLAHKTKSSVLRVLFSIQQAIQKFLKSRFKDNY
ncbi:glycosyltransferase [Algoriphagus lutimaris]|uniref:glycosyltransferase family 2 protein n=1 Tax=Algoriphagus lutimaris TaxID=613197 RepID=UPI00196B8797|nr:glycosyltransferase [Algoriphagus lutimaris]MBN3518689.1 glycosyltransferase [Algoriphagus lutimaris]